MSRAATLTFLTATTALTAAASVSAASIEDRYGPPHPASGEAATTIRPSTGFLSWSMKAPAPASDAPMDTPRAAFVPVPAPAKRVAAAALPTSLYSAYPARASAPQPERRQARWTPAPYSQPAAPLAPAAGSPGQAPHFYSVHRQFGLSPDPIPLPRQFFADNAPDLAAAPPPLPPRPVPGTQAATSSANTASNRARQVEIETADSAAN
jgi:hypothetical protein